MTAILTGDREEERRDHSGTPSRDRTARAACKGRAGAGERAEKAGTFHFLHKLA